MMWLVEARTDGGPWRLLAECYDKGKALRLAEALASELHAEVYADTRVVEVELASLPVQ